MRRLVFGLAVLGALLVVPALQADDQAVGQRVVQTLQQQKTQGLLKDFSIDLQVENGVVWLKGEVANQQQRDLVLGAVRGLEGVEQLVDDLRTPHVAKETPKEESAYDSFSNGVKDSLDSVTGFLGLGSSKEKPVEAAPVAAKPIPAAPLKRKGQATARVMQARPDMPVVDDNAIAQAIGKSLTAKKDAGALQAFNVNLSVSGGTVWMKGYAANEEQRGQILASAQNVNGVVQVVNDIVLQAPATIQVASAPEAVTPPLQAPVQPVSQPQQVQRVAAVQAPAAAPVQMMQSAQGMAAARYEQPNMPNYAWPTYASYPNYSQVTYPRQYSPSAWPYIGPFYPYPQVPLGWRKVTLEWDDGWWFLDFESN
tara:strand:+ start:1766 stop:2869 length:1104 start_codon:yes stop_codon:yes gene_type:complete